MGVKERGGCLGKSYDAVLAAKVNCRLGSKVGQFVESGATTACKYQGQSIFAKRADITINNFAACMLLYGNLL